MPIYRTMTAPTTRAVVSYGPYQNGGWKLKNITLRPLKEHELLVELVASGICHTDLHFAGLESGYGVYYPRIMGHEGQHERVVEGGHFILLTASIIKYRIRICARCRKQSAHRPARRFSPTIILVVSKLRAMPDRSSRTLYQL